MISQPFVRSTLAVIAVSIFATSALAQKKDGIPAGINWYGVLSDGLEEAKRSQRPILLVSAAPQCSGVPGMW